MALSERIYRLLLHLYPSDFRRAFGDDLAQLFTDQSRSLRGRPGRLAVFWLLAATDVLYQALLEWAGRLRAQRLRATETRSGRRKGAFMDAFRQDLRFAFRSLGKDPGFTWVAAFTLAVGIGATSAVFSVVSAVLLKPLPYDHPERLVRLFEHSVTVSQWPVAPGNFLDYRERSRSIEALAVYRRADAELSDGARSERLIGMRVSSGFFELLGFAPLAGTSFTRAHERAEAAPVAMVSESFWKERLGGDPDALGRPLSLDGAPHDLIGIVPDSLEHVGGSYRSLPHGTRVDVWRPVIFDREAPRGQHFLNAIGRLRADRSIDEAAAELEAISVALEAEFPSSNESWRTSLMPLHEEIVHDARPRILAVFGAVGLVLLIACVNVANLMLARAQAREQEMALRVAMGAARGRLVWQTLTESLVLAGMGGGLGLLFGWAGAQAIAALGPERLPRLGAVALDLPVLGFTLAATLFTAVAFGVLPAWRQSRTATAAAQSSNRATDSRARARMRSSLVVAELAIAIVLLLGAGLLLQTLENLQSTEPGFDESRVLTGHVALPEARYPETTQVTGFFYELAERLREVPAVEAAGMGSDLPWTGYDENLGVRRSDRLEESVGARYHHATPGYFAALGIPLLAGRDFDRADDEKASDRIVINRRLASVLWPEAEPQEAVGRRLAFGREPSEGDWLTVIGVVGDVKDHPGAGEAKPAVYLAFRQKPWVRELYLIVRSGRPPAELLELLRDEVRSMDPELPVARATMLQTVSDRVFSEPRFVSWLTSAFASIALLLALVGLYGVIAYTVSRESRTIAIHMALGARAGDIRGRVLAQSSKLVAMGVMVGALAAAGLTRWAASLLYQVDPLDPVIFGAAVLLLGVTAFAASLLPASRASRVEPIETLRHS